MYVLKAQQNSWQQLVSLPVGDTMDSCVYTSGAHNLDLAKTKGMFTLCRKMLLTIAVKHGDREKKTSCEPLYLSGTFTVLTYFCVLLFHVKISLEK